MCAVDRTNNAERIPAAAYIAQNVFRAPPRHSAGRHTIEGKREGWGERFPLIRPSSVIIGFPRSLIRTDVNAVRFVI